MKLKEAENTTGGKIRTARVDAGLSASDLSLMVKLPDGNYPSIGYILRVERGEIRPNFNFVQQIAKVTNKPIDYFSS